MAQTLSDAWSVVGSLFSLVSVWLELKLRLILATHASTDTKLRRNRPCSACRIVGRWTSCNTNKWDCNDRGKKTHYYLYFNGVNCQLKCGPIVSFGET